VRLGIHPYERTVTATGGFQAIRDGSVGADLFAAQEAP
jgi:hypothetical protein